MSTSQSLPKRNRAYSIDDLENSESTSPNIRKLISSLQTHDQPTSLPTKSIASANTGDMPSGMSAHRRSRHDELHSDCSSPRRHGSPPRSGERRDIRSDDRVYRRRSRSRSRSPKRRDYGYRSDERSPPRREGSPSRLNARERPDARREFSSKNAAASATSSRRSSTQQDNIATITSPLVANSSLAESNSQMQSNIHLLPSDLPSTNPLTPTAVAVADTVIQNITEIMSTFSTLATKQVMLTIEQQAARKEFEQCKEDSKKLESHYTGYPNLVEQRKVAYSKAKNDAEAIEEKLQQVNVESATAVKNFVTKIVTSNLRAAEGTEAIQELRKQCNSLEEKCKDLTDENQAIKKEVETLKHEAINLNLSFTARHENQQRDLKSHHDHLLKLDTGVAKVTQGFVPFQEFPTSISTIKTSLSEAKLDITSLKETLELHKTDNLKAEDRAIRQDAQLAQHQKVLKGLSHVASDPDNESSLENMLQASTHGSGANTILTKLQNCQSELLSLRLVLNGQSTATEELYKRIESLENISAKSNSDIAVFATLDNRVTSVSNDIKRIRSEMAEDKDILSAQIFSAQSRDSNVLANLTQQFQQNRSVLQGQEGTIGKFAELLQNLETSLTSVRKEVEDIKPQLLQSQSQAQQASASILDHSDSVHNDEVSRMNIDRLETLVYNAKEEYRNLLVLEQERIARNESNLISLGERVDTLSQDRSQELLSQRISAAEDHLRDNTGRQHQVDTILGDRIGHLESAFGMIKDEVDGCVIATNSIDSRLNNINTLDMCRHILEQIAVLYPYVQNTDNAFQEAKAERENLKAAIAALEKRVQRQQSGRDSFGPNSRPTSETRSEFDSSVSALKTKVSALLENGTPGEQRTHRGMRQDIDTLAVDIHRMAVEVKSLRASLLASQAEHRRDFQEIRQNISPAGGPGNIPIDNNNVGQSRKPNKTNGHAPNSVLGNGNQSGTMLENDDEPEVGDPDGSDNDN